MDIKLIFPPFEATTYNRCLIPPLSIVSLYSYLKDNGYKSHLFDFELDKFMSKRNSSKINYRIFSDRLRVKNFINGKRDFYLRLQIGRIINSIKPFNNSIACFSIIDLTQLFFSLAISKVLKKDFGSIIIFGGPYVTLNKGYLLNNFAFIDYEIIGLGENSLFELVRCLDNDKEISGVSNLVYRKEGNICETVTKHFDINNSSLPDFSALPIEQYRAINNSLVLPYQLISGCSEACTFCAHRTISNKLSLKDVDKVVQELSTLKEKHNTRYFYFCDNLINASTKYVEELCDSIIRCNLDILWIDHAKPDILSENLLGKIRDSGCIQLYYGIESASQRVLDSMNKRILVENIKKCLELSNKAGIWNHVSFIIGYLNEEEKDFNETLDFIKANRNLIDSIMVSPFYIPKNSTIYKNPSIFGVDLGDIEEEPVNLFFEHCNIGYKEGSNKINRVIEQMGLFPFKVNNQIISINQFFNLFSEQKSKDNVKKAMLSI